MQTIESADEDRDVLSTDPRPSARRRAVHPLGSYAAAVVLRLAQELPRIRVEKRVADREESADNPL